jgi:hypothetical protein
MEMDELVRNIEKARAEALEYAKTERAAAKQLAGAKTVGGASEMLVHEINASASIGVARALDTVLGWNTPPPLIEPD